MRRDTSSVSESLKAAGALRSLLSTVDRDFGVIARRAVGVAGEDHVVHLGRAHGLVGGLAHDPAHRLDQIGLAAAVRADHAGQSWFDHKVGRFDEGLEADQAQPRELHAGRYVHSPAAAAKGIMRLTPGRSVRIAAASARRMNRRDSKRNSAAGFSRPSRSTDPPAARRGRAGAWREAKNPYPVLR